VEKREGRGYRQDEGEKARDEPERETKAG